MTNNYTEVAAWEKWANKHLPQKFGLTVLEFCDDYKRNHDEGTDAITKELGRVDFKWNRVFDYKKVFFALEHKPNNGKTWVENKKALELGVIVVHPWKDYDRPGFYKLVGYPLEKLKELLEIKRLGGVPFIAKDSGAQFYKIEMEMLDGIKVWDSGWKWLGREEQTWHNLQNTKRK